MMRRPHIRGLDDRIQMRPSVLVLTGSALLLSFLPLGMRQFGGFDHSSLILSGWYMHLGVVPYRDVPYTLPPLFYIGAGWAFRIFGLHWWAFVAMTGVFALGTFLWLVALFRIAGMSAALASSVAFVSELATVLIGSYWWYNPVTSVAIILAFASALACLERQESRSAWASVAGSVALLLLSKPNGWPALGCAGVLLISWKWRRAALAILAGALAAALICTVHRFTPADVLRSYAKIAGSRGYPDLWAGSGWTLSLLAFAVFLVWLLLWLLVSGFPDWQQHWRQYECCVAATLASLWAAFTNFEIKTSDLMPLVVVIVVLAFRPWNSHAVNTLHRNLAVSLLLLLTAVSSYWAVTRARVRGIGEGMFFELPTSAKQENGFFAGLRTGQRFPAILQEMEDALRSHPGTVFFGPRLEFGYAAFQRTPGRGLPLFWQLGAAYSLDEQPQIVRAFDDDMFATLIFPKDRFHDFAMLPSGLLKEIDRKYDRVDYPDLIVFVRRTLSGD